MDNRKLNSDVSPSGLNPSYYMQKSNQLPMFITEDNPRSMGNMPNPENKPKVAGTFPFKAENPNMGVSPAELMPKTGTMPTELMPKTGTMPTELMPKTGAMPAELMPKTGTMPTELMPKASENMYFQAVYPEIYYKLQPHIMMVCDQMDTYGAAMPTQEMLDKMSDDIYDDVVRLYPDMAEYAREFDERTGEGPAVYAQTIFGDRGFPRFGRRFRRRGLFRDIIGILLLSELFRRRRPQRFFF